MSDAKRVGKALEAHLSRREAGLWALADAQSKELETEAKAGARWTDRTSNARQGLKGTATRTGKTIMVRLMHQVSYGKYLEKSMSGKYAILKPTMDRNKKQMKNTLQDYWNKTK